MTEDVTLKIEDFFAQYRLRKYFKGQILILSGDDTDYIFKIVKGKVKQYDVTHQGDEIILNVYKPPAFFPMSLAINQITNPYIYEAETDIEIRQAPVGDVLAFIKENPDVMFDLLSRLYRGVDGLLGRMAHLMAGSARSRIIYELLVEARRFGTELKEGGCELHISEKDLGSRAGLSRETVSRELHKLKSEKLVVIQGKGIHLTSVTALDQILNRQV